MCISYSLDEKEEKAVVYERVLEDESDENNDDLEADKGCGDADDKEEEDDADEKSSMTLMKRKRKKIGL